MRPVYFTVKSGARESKGHLEEVADGPNQDWPTAGRAYEIGRTQCFDSKNRK